MVNENVMEFVVDRFQMMTLIDLMKNEYEYEAKRKQKVNTFQLTVFPHFYSE